MTPSDAPQNPESLEASGIGREILRLALPSAVQHLLQMLVFVIDTKLIAYYSAEILQDSNSIPLAAMGVAGPIAWSVSMIMSATAVGATAIVARRIGEGASRKAAVSTAQAVVLAFAIGLLCSLPSLLYYKEIVSLFVPEGKDPLLSSTASAYLWWFFLFFPLRCTAISLEASFRGAGDAKTPLFAGLGANVVNVILSTIFVFGWIGQARGLEGAGIGTALAGAAEAVFLIWALRRSSSRIQCRWSDYAPSISEFKNILRISGPSFVENCIFHAGFLTYQLAIFQLQESQMAAHRIAITIQSLAFLPAEGFYSAAASLAGRTLGMGKRSLAILSAKKTVVLGLIFMLPVSLLMFFAGEGICSLFIEDQKLIEIASLVLKIAAFEIPFLLISRSLTGSLRGAGETTSPVLITLLGSWAIRVPCSWLFAIEWEMGLSGIWYATLLDWIVRSALCFYFVKQGNWLNKRV